MAFTHSLGTVLSCHTDVTTSQAISKNCSLHLPAFTITGSMLELPGALLFLNFPSVLLTSFLVGGFPISSSVCLCFTFCSCASSNWLGTFKTLLKCLFHLSCCSVVVVHDLPSSSSTATTLVGILPLRPRWRSLMHCHTSLRPNFSFFASCAFLLNHSSFAFLTACLVLPQDSLNSS